MKRLFVINNGKAAGWSASTKTTFTVEINGGLLKVTTISGRDPFTYEVNTAIGRMLKIMETECGALPKYQRKEKFRFVYKTGSSGCQDTFIETEGEWNDGFPRRRFLFHESCFGKTDGFECFLYDYLDLAVVDGFLRINDGNYFYPEEEDVNKDQEMLIISPRNTYKEEGWMYDIEDNVDAKAVPLCIWRD